MAVQQPKPPPNQQLYEFLLFGSVSESELPSLLHRLRGLADFATCGGIAFTDKEQTYKIGMYVCSVLCAAHNNYGI